MTGAIVLLGIGVAAIAVIFFVLGKWTGEAESLERCFRDYEDRS